MQAMPGSPKLVTVFGGTGFVGRNVVRALARRGYRIRVAVRRPNLGLFLKPLGTVGQVELAQANLRYPASVAQVLARTDIVVNVVGLLGESGRQTFDSVIEGGAAAISDATPVGTPIVHVSAIGASADSPARYGTAKAAAERVILDRHPDAVILRPSVVFGNGDSFLNRFAALARALPVLPLPGADTRFQPVFVGDVAEAVARGVDGTIAGGIYELGGPEIRTLREIVGYVLSVTERKRAILSMPLALANLQGRALEIADALTLGMLPADLKFTRDQVALLQQDNVVSDTAIAAGRTLAGMGIVPRAMEATVPSYLTRYRKTGQFDVEHVA